MNALSEIDNMNSQNYIYSKILDKLGWFQPKVESYRIESDYNTVHVVAGANPITENTVVGYYPGSFGTFHDGHVSAVKQSIDYLKNISDDYVLAISPANSDYAVEKYGKDSCYSRNDYRFNKICEALAGIDGNIVIDLSPMLNSVCDTNFPLLVKDFVEAQTGVPIGNMKNKPVVVVGKDRKDFQLIKEIVDDLDFLYIEDTTGSSTSAIKKNDNHAICNKKKIMLRCANEEEFNLFNSYYSDEYTLVLRTYLKDELLFATRRIDALQIDFTICKDYANLGVPYHRLSRKFIHALDVPKEFIHDAIDFKGKNILDSDVYSGETKRYIERLGGNLISVFDYSNLTDEWDIVDFNDFKNPMFRYPYYDVSTRCSMSAFTVEDHNKYKEFLERVKTL